MGKQILALIESRRNSWFSRRFWPRLLVHFAWGAVIGVQLLVLLDHNTFSESQVRPIFDSIAPTENAAVTPRTPRTWFKVFLGILIRSARADELP